jgi:hypothetical protein
MTFDLGNDPVAFARKRFDIGRDLVARQDARSLQPQANYSVLRRSVSYAVRDMGRAAGILARQIGGLRTLRDHPGSGRDPLQPVSAAVQRDALDALATGILSADSLKVSPSLRRRLAPDYDERLESFAEGTPLTTDLSVDDLISQLRKAVLAQLMTVSLGAVRNAAAGAVAPASAQAPTPIKISYQLAYWALPIYVATEKNWWAEAGLKPEFVVYPAGAQQIAGAPSKSWDVGGTGSPPAVLGFQRYEILTVGLSNDESATNAVPAAVA